MTRVLDIQGIIRYYLSQNIRFGDVVIDATAGRGRDTLFLAECVGQSGRVISIDIQADAIAATRSLLESRGFEDRVSLYQMDHALMAELTMGKVRAVVFNLGYLPGSNKKVITLASSTIPALRTGLDLLEAEGIMALTVYRGHPGAEQEAGAVQELLKNLPKKKFSVLEGHFPNQGETSPYWILVQKNVI